MKNILITGWLRKWVEYDQYAETVSLQEASAIPDHSGRYGAAYHGGMEY
ncbi:MAG: hypothetical protein R6X10_12330 [Desulfobacterales bacterium]